MEIDLLEMYKDYYGKKSEINSITIVLCPLKSGQDLYTATLKRENHIRISDSMSIDLVKIQSENSEIVYLPEDDEIIKVFD